MSILDYLDLKVPANWKKVRLDTLASVIDPEPSHRAPALAEGEGFPYIGIRDVNSDGTVNTETARPIKEESLIEQEKRFTIDSGDLIFCRVATLGNPKILKINERVALSATLALVKPKKDKVNNIFLLYLLDSDYIKLQTELFSTGSTRKSLGMETLRKFEVLLPPLNIQDNIAEYLYEKISTVDNLIESKKVYISLLEQQRQSIISEAVTKGLNPNVKLKDSGIEWIGEIPEHWYLKKLKYLLKEGSEGIKIGPFGSALKLDMMVDEGYKVYGQENLIKGDFSLGKRFITDELFNDLINYAIQEGDVLVSMMGTIGKCKVVPKDFKEGIMDSHLIRMRFNAIQANSDYIALVISNAQYIKEQFNLNSKGSIMSGLNSTIIKSLDIVLPSLEEQNEIIVHLNLKLEKLDSIVSEIHLQVEKLKEYRQSLIYEAVTGKIDVRDMELD
jgi:type I restriction enzyme, S subunit